MSELSISELFDDDSRKRIEDAIREAELGTSGEIRVHGEDECSEDPLDHAAFIFQELNMHRTVLRNGVLVYIAIKNHKLAIIGDVGINSITGPDFWKEVNDLMIEYFKKDQIIEGMLKGIERIGQKLKEYFPIEAKDKNELPNQVTFGHRKKSKYSFRSREKR